MNFVNDLFSKILWALLVVVLIAGGYIFLVRKLVKPPQIAATPTQPSQNPQQPNQNPQQTVSSTDNYNPTLVGGTDVVEDPAEDMLPALAQSEDVVLEMPEKLEPGGILKYYFNTEGVEYPDPVKSSPSAIYKTDGLEVTTNKKGDFQEVSGYFRVPKTDYYNFIVNIPEAWDKHKPTYTQKHMKLKVDGFTLSHYSGGKVYLEEGWHKVSFFIKVTIYDIYPTITWAEEGELAKPLKIWREVEEEEIVEEPQELVRTTSEE